MATPSRLDRLREKAKEMGLIIYSNAPGDGHRFYQIYHADGNGKHTGVQAAHLKGKKELELFMSAFRRGYDKGILAGEGEEILSDLQLIRSPL